MEALLTADGLVALATLASLEIVLGIDNVVFIAILSARLPIDQQAKARRYGLLAAMFMRIILLLCVSWLMKLTEPLFSLLGHGMSGKDLILLGGGLFLIGKATHEIHEKVEAAGMREEHAAAKAAKSFMSVILQVMVVDMVFSLDSVITAVGMVDEIAIMIIAVILAVIVMMIFADAVSRFVEKHPTVKILALSFLLLIGVMLVAEAFGKHIEKGYIYFAMGFSLFVQAINIWIANRRRRAMISTTGTEKPATS